MKCSDNCGEGIVVLGVVDRPHNCFLGVYPVPHQDVDGGGHGLQQVSSGIPPVASLIDREVLSPSGTDVLLDELPEGPPVTNKIATSGLVGLVIFQVSGY